MTFVFIYFSEIFMYLIFSGYQMKPYNINLINILIKWKLNKFFDKQRVFTVQIMHFHMALL